MGYDLWEKIHKDGLRSLTLSELIFVKRDVDAAFEIKCEAMCNYNGEAIFIDEQTLDQLRHPCNDIS